MSSSSQYRKNNTNNILIHVIFWLLLIHLLFDIAGLYDSFQELYRAGEFIDEAFIIIPNMIGLFYWNSHFLIPRYLNQQDWKKYLLFLLASFASFVFMGYTIDQFLDGLGFEFNVPSEEVIDFIAQFNILIIGISTSLGLSKIALENTAQKKEAQAKQKVAELKYLTAQVNPHFLHNTLNTIYSLANDENASTTQDAVLKLSNMMRYMVRESNQPTVLLSAEIEFLQEFIDLQKLRLAGAIPVTFTINGQINQQKIAPLLFITLVENTFKHGIQYHPPQPVQITLTIQDHQLILETLNVLKQQLNEENTGTGLANLRKRLTYLYSDKHELNVSRANQLFVAKLILPLKV